MWMDFESANLTLQYLVVTKGNVCLSKYDLLLPPDVKRLKIKWKEVKQYLKINALLKTIDIDAKFLDNTDSVLTQVLLFGYRSLILNNNSNIITTAIEYTLSSEKFDEPLP